MKKIILILTIFIVSSCDVSTENKILEKNITNNSNIKFEQSSIGKNVKVRNQYAKSSGICRNGKTSILKEEKEIFNIDFSKIDTFNYACILKTEEKDNNKIRIYFKILDGAGSGEGSGVALDFDIQNNSFNFISFSDYILEEKGLEILNHNINKLSDNYYISEDIKNFLQYLNKNYRINNFSNISSMY